MEYFVSTACIADIFRVRTATEHGKNPSARTMRAHTNANATSHRRYPLVMAVASVINVFPRAPEYRSFSAVPARPSSKPVPGLRPNRGPDFKQTAARPSSKPLPGLRGNHRMAFEQATARPSNKPLPPTPGVKSSDRLHAREAFAGLRKAVVLGFLVWARVFVRHGRPNQYTKFLSRSERRVLVQ